jgi:hypothetical protein
MNGRIMRALYVWQKMNVALGESFENRFVLG